MPWLNPVTFDFPADHISTHMPYLVWTGSTVFLLLWVDVSGVLCSQEGSTTSGNIIMDPDSTLAYPDAYTESYVARALVSDTGVLAISYGTDNNG